ncbi:MAG TPA: DinB family protein [Cyclobacteriaceae bacterium]|nr:DinB family protein [Cyclobacteriaceae bacterium]
MKKILIISLIFNASIAMAQNSNESPTLKSVLLEQLKTTHTKKDWFVPVNVALEGLTAEQALWKDGSGNHSIAQLASHLIFWNGRLLAKFKGLTPEEFGGNNEETFLAYDKKSWDEVTKKLDSVFSEWEKLIEAADENKLKDWYASIANMNTHNAYHTGQIIYIRKLQGSWDADKGVK